MKHLSLFVALLFLISCQKSEEDYQIISSYPNVEATFANQIDLNHLANYANQQIPNYITRDNTGTNFITDKGATLGRILFYDKNLSSSNTISCSSCHQQKNAFGDTATASLGVNGTTTRHTMRLINTRFAVETKFFWDERAPTLELQTTQPIQNHTEMGFSGTQNDLPFSALIAKLKAIGYYKELFQFVYGNDEITENKIQLALAQFIRSIQSFDSKYDAGRSVINNDLEPFLNFTPQENNGKLLFNSMPVYNLNGERISGGLGCFQCHKGPEFDIDPNSKNNGFVASLQSIQKDFSNTRSPSLRDLTKADGTANGPMMHAGQFATINAAIGHYGTINTLNGNNNLDPRLTNRGIGQHLNLTQTEVENVAAFIKSLAGIQVYTDQKWSNPFE